jgi:electron transfer flavoprotein alpha subunit
MALLVYLEAEDSKMKKSAAELASFTAALANGDKVFGLTINALDASDCGAYGVDEIHVLKTAATALTAEQTAQLIAETSKEIGAKTVVIGSSADAKYFGALVAAQLEAAYIPNVVGLTETQDGAPLYKRSVFTNKGFAYTKATTETVVIGLAKNAFGVQPNEKSIQVVSKTATLTDAKVTSEGTEKASGKATIADADIVVSAGRGLKGPENWGMIEELAEVLGAATACSKPVSDMGWRPHGEHVGQTGKPVATNLYIAIGISGAIQHLAGINASKVKVVINNDPEAPFFKAADYGVVGDAFEVVPQLIEKLKNFKAQNA